MNKVNGREWTEMYTKGTKKKHTILNVFTTWKESLRRINTRKKKYSFEKIL